MPSLRERISRRDQGRRDLVVLPGGEIDEDPGVGAIVAEEDGSDGERLGGSREGWDRLIKT